MSVAMSAPREHGDRKGHHGAAGLIMLRKNMTPTLYRPYKNLTLTVEERPQPSMQYIEERATLYPLQLSLAGL